MPEDPRRAHGADRLEPGEGAELWLACPLPKTWLPRRPKTLTTAEYPGTAVDWQGGLFEVVESQPQADGSIRYRLAPWGDAHAIRRMERYDAESEAGRGAERENRRESVRRRRFSILLAPLAGLMPGRTQREMEGEFGAPALAMTISSALPLFAIGCLGLVRSMLSAFGAALDFPALLAPPVPIALYLFGESALRLGSAFAAGEPMGSLPVVLAAEAWREEHAPPADASDRAAPASEPERDALDRFRMLEPMLSFLTPSEQERLAQRFGFEPIRWGKITAAVLFLVGGGNALVSALHWANGLGAVDLVWLLIGGCLALEQLLRWGRLSAGAPAGSVLGVAVRPLAKPLLGTEQSEA